MVAHGVHMAAQRCFWVPLELHMAAEAPNGCPRGSLWLLRGSTRLPMRLHMAAQRLQMAAHGALRGCIWLQRGCILLHRGCLWLPCGRYAVYAASRWARLGSQDPENMARWW